MKSRRIRYILYLLLILFQFQSTLSKARIQTSIHPNNVPSTPRGPIKDWTIITYMAADNDLAPFARKNLRQQADIGSTSYINIVTQLDTRVAGNIKITKRYYVEKNRLVVTNHNDPFSQKMDSGSPDTLISCCKWAIENYPAHHYALVLWNHGTGIIDIGRPRRINPLYLFSLNPENNLIELNRSIPFLDFIQGSYLLNNDRAICFDDSTGHYLTNQHLDRALNEVCTKHLHGRKFSLICFDACLMSMLEIANIVKNYADIMVASQEVELGNGYPYSQILSPFTQHTLDKRTFAKHIVSCYGTAYTNITNDFTQSAIDLAMIDNLEKNVNSVAIALLECIKQQKGTTVRDTVRSSCHKLLCTHFDEPSYKDLHHFYSNLLSNIKHFQFVNENQATHLRSLLQKLLSEGLQSVSQVVLANVAGKNLSLARGISIYFPERHIHNSYQNTTFAHTNNWFMFLQTYLM